MIAVRLKRSQVSIRFIFLIILILISLLIVRGDFNTSINISNNQNNSNVSIAPNFSIFLDKGVYNAGEILNITLKPAANRYLLNVYTPLQNYTLISLFYITSDIGRHTINGSLYYGNYSGNVSVNFIVKNASAINYSLENSSQEHSNITNLGSENISSENLTQNNASNITQPKNNTTEISEQYIEDENFILKDILIKKFKHLEALGINKTENGLNIKFKDKKNSIKLNGVKNHTKLDKVTFFKNIKHNTDIVFVNDIELDSANIVLEKNGHVNMILQCADNDFDIETGSCINWLETNIYFEQNSTHIWFDVSHFSAYAGAYIEVLNVQSYPVIGGFWTVYFNTSGAGNLTISGIDGTEFGEDLEFIELYCGVVPVDTLIIDKQNREIPYDIYLLKRQLDELKK